MKRRMGVPFGERRATSPCYRTQLHNFREGNQTKAWELVTFWSSLHGILPVLGLSERTHRFSFFDLAPSPAREPLCAWRRPANRGAQPE
jgi:hypothetical protein